SADVVRLRRIGSCDGGTEAGADWRRPTANAFSPISGTRQTVEILADPACCSNCHWSDDGGTAGHPGRRLVADYANTACGRRGRTVVVLVDRNATKRLASASGRAGQLPRDDVERASFGIGAAPIGGRPARSAGAPAPRPGRRPSRRRPAASPRRPTPR